MRHSNAIRLPDHQAAAVFLILGWIFLMVVAYAAITGRIPRKGAKSAAHRTIDFIHGVTYCISREEEPFNFWLTFAAYLLLSIAFISSGIYFLLKQP